MRPLQRFSPEYLESIRDVSPDQVVRFLDEFRQIHAPNRPSRLISMRVPEPLLESFKNRCRIEGSRYQTRIKELMLEWLGSGAK
jgi:predicted DNA binding CopG/RHH family protein